VCFPLRKNLNMEFTHNFGVLTYRHHANGIEHEALHRIEALSYEDAARQVVGDGVTLIADTKIHGVSYLVAKVWDGDGFRYAYHYPA